MYNRMIQFFGFLLVTFAALSVHGASSNPNIIYILCDDLGYGDVGIYNPESKIRTPHMDRLGREGMVFTDAHANSAVCTPTRYGILTGRYAWRSRLKKEVLSGFSDHLIERGRMTVASLLKDHGYHTAFIGKWHLGWDWMLLGKKNTNTGLRTIQPVDYTKPIKNGPKENGFIYSYGHSGSLDMPPYVYVENGMPTAIPSRDTEVTSEESKNGWWRKGPTASDFDHQDVLPNFTQRAVKYIAKQSQNKQPFFLYLPLPSPHTPVLPTDQFLGTNGINSAYADFVTMTDACIGQVVQAVEKAGISDNTLIVVTSDNGCSPQADYPELLAQKHNPSHIYRGHKADIFEGGHRVPFIVRWPSTVKASSTTATTICLTDMLATCAEIVDEKLPPQAGEDSFSLLSILKGTFSGYNRTETIHHSFDGTFSIRMGKWKLIDAPHSGGWSTPRPGKDEKIYKKMPKVQLYDMEKDPSETTNIQNEFPEVVERLRTRLERLKQTGEENTEITSEFIN